VDFSQLDAGLSNLIDSMGDLTLPSPDLLHSYRNGIMVPFFEVFTAGDKSYEPFMKSSSSYGQYLSTGQDFKLYIVSGTSAPTLQQELIDFASARGIQAPQ
jgi:predicted dienelactone hydrolase